MLVIVNDLGVAELDKPACSELARDCSLSIADLKMAVKNVFSTCANFSSNTACFANITWHYAVSARNLFENYSNYLLLKKHIFPASLEVLCCLENMLKFQNA